jgi:hypothetical protein
VNALSCATEIKDLFLVHGRSEFPEFFDRAYPAAIANGARSWVGRGSDGRLVMHIACMPRRFRYAGRDVTGGLLSNLMVAGEHRSFFPALQLVRRLVQDSRESGLVDFLYADPNEQSRALLRGTRFGIVGTLRRYVLPVANPRWPLDAGIRAFHRLLHIARKSRRPRAVIAHTAREFSLDAVSVPHDESPTVAAYHDDGLYRSRLAGYPGDTDWWLTVHRRGASDAAEAALLVRGPDASGFAVLHALRRRPGARPAWFLPVVLGELRRRGCRRLQITTVAESELARDLTRGGFIARRETVPLFGLATTDAGASVLKAANCWEITELECDR